MGATFKYYLLSVLAYCIPIVFYIAFPGKVIFASLIRTILLCFVILGMNRQNITLNKYHRTYWLLCLFVVIMGFLHYLFVGDFNRVSVALILSSYLNYFFVIYTLMVNGVDSIKYFLKSFLLILIPVAVLSMIFWDGFESFDVPHIVAPLTIFFCVCPYLPRKQSFFIVSCVVLSVVYDYSVRVCLLTLVVSLILLLGYYLIPKKLFESLLKLSRLLFFSLPIVFLLLAVYCNFNIFQEIENMELSPSVNLDAGRKSEDRAINTDSRTAVYLDVVNGVSSISDIIWGKGEVINLKSAWNPDDRHSTEAGMLNIFLKYGLIGCFVFLLLIWTASYKGLYKSGNYMCKMVAVYLSYRFFLSFVEDPIIDITTFIAIGICVNKEIRRMTDKELLNYFSGKKRKYLYAYK